MPYCPNCGSKLICPKCEKKPSESKESKLRMNEGESIAEFLGRMMQKDKK